MFEYLILKVWFYKYLPCFVSLVTLFLSMIAWIEIFFCWIVVLLLGEDSANLFIRTFGSVIISVSKKVLS